MNKLSTYSLIILFSTLTFAPQTQAATLAPPLSKQVQQVAEWFVGFFNNAPQVANQPLTPRITMANCTVQIVNTSLSKPTRSIYLEQIIEGRPPRTRYYQFDSVNSTLNLSIRSFISGDPFLGLCSRPSSERIIDFNQLKSNSCDLQLMWKQDPVRYTGNNDPDGCPGTFANKIISDIEISPNQINSLDIGLAADGTSIFAIPIEFSPVNVPENSLDYSWFLIGILGTFTTWRRQKKSRNCELNSMKKTVP